MNTRHPTAVVRLAAAGYVGPRDRDRCLLCNYAKIMLHGDCKRVRCKLHKAETLPGGWCPSFRG